MELSNEFRIRCSKIGDIMTEPRTKADAVMGLSKTCIYYVHEWIKEQPEFYGKSKNFKNKYTEKGILLEPESITYAASVLGWGDVCKNEFRIFNEWLEGEADIILNDAVADIKNSWSQNTFPIFDKEIPIKGYDWQLEGYCELWSVSKGLLVYTLMDAPEHMIEKAAKAKQYELGMEDLEAELYDTVRADMTYSQYPDRLRIKVFKKYRNTENILKVQAKVEQIRNYIKTL